MKEIFVFIITTDLVKLETSEIRLSKKGKPEEIDVIASGISSIFIKSKDALKIASKGKKK